MCKKQSDIKYVHGKKNGSKTWREKWEKWFITNLHFFKKLLGATKCALVLQKKWHSRSICGCWQNRICGFGSMCNDGVEPLQAAVKIQTGHGVQPRPHIHLKIMNMRKLHCQNKSCRQKKTLRLSKICNNRFITWDWSSVWLAFSRSLVASFRSAFIIRAGEGLSSTFMTVAM